MKACILCLQKCLFSAALRVTECKISGGLECLSNLHSLNENMSLKGRELWRDGEMAVTYPRSPLLNTDSFLLTHMAEFLTFCFFLVLLLAFHSVFSSPCWVPSLLPTTTNNLSSLYNALWVDVGPGAQYHHKVSDEGRQVLEVLI